MTTAHHVEDRAKRTTLWYGLVLDDPHPPPEYLRKRFLYEPRSTQIPVARYTSRAWHDLERERLWRRTWQMACREENIPDVGSYVVYDIAGDSYLVVRTRDGIKAYVNACLHRGRALKDYDGRCSEFRCSFHGFTWRLDGSLRYTPAPAEFPDIEADRDGWRLPEARVGRWGGFVFINPDPDAEPLETFLGTLPRHFARWDFEHRYLQAHVAKKIRCNWKVAQEAFDEGLHLGATHPQSAPYVGDVNAAVDVYGNYARQISPSGTPIEDLPGEATEEDILKRMLDVREGEDLPIPFSQRSTARDAMAEAARERWRQVLGDEADDISDAELVDHWNYAVFPNLHPWGGYNRIVYRFRPNGDRHDESIFEVMFLTPYRGERPPTARVTHLDFGEPWTNAPELQTLGLVMEQDTFNMEAVQRGLETIRRQYVTASRFQEGMITWRHDLLTRWIGQEPTAGTRLAGWLARSGTRSTRGPSTWTTATAPSASPWAAGRAGSSRTAGTSRARSSRPIPSCACGCPAPGRRATTGSAGCSTCRPSARPPAMEAGDLAAAAEAIRQAVLRYCRGVDHLDAALMLSAYHDDARDDHGVFTGPAADLCRRVVESHRRYDATMHCVLNHAIDITDGTHAAGEVYNVTYLLRTADGGRHLDTWWGRYLDRYECRDGRWAIADRVCVHEWTRTEPLGAAMPIAAHLFRQGHQDRRTGHA